MSDPRRDHARLLMRQQRLMNTARREMAAEVSSAVLARCGERGVYDIGCHTAVMRDVDAVIARYYGRAPGDPRAVLLGVITECTRGAWELAIERSRGMATRHLSRFAPDILTTLQERARNRERAA